MIFLLFFLLISSQASNCMEKSTDKPNFGALFEEFKIPANHLLSEEQRTAIQPTNYIKDQDTAHAALRSLAQNMAQLAQEKESITMNSDQVIEFEEYIINLRDGSLGLKHIEVVDELTAIAYSVNLLSAKKKQSLQKAEFCSNQRKALSTLIHLGDKTYDILEEKKLLADTITPIEYVNKFVIRKLDELSKNYNKPNISMVFSSGEVMGFDTISDMRIWLESKLSKEDK
jgi:hypothetical protein